MKTRVPEVLHILAQRFAADYAAKYGMPELAQATFTHQREQNELPKVKAECFIQPTGQMAALVLALWIEVQVETNEDGLVCASVSLSYKHHGGGSNGKNDSFLVLTANTYRPEYDGFIPMRHYHEIIQRSFDTFTKAQNAYNAAKA